jgi:hypothetical protein
MRGPWLRVWSLVVTVLWFGLVPGCGGGPDDVQPTTGTSRSALPIERVTLWGDGLRITFHVSPDALQVRDSSVTFAADARIDGDEILATVVREATWAPSEVKQAAAIEGRGSGRVLGPEIVPPGGTIPEFRAAVASKYLPRPFADHVLVDTSSGTRFVLGPGGTIGIEALLPGWEPSLVQIAADGTRRQRLRLGDASLIFVQEVGRPPTSGPVLGADLDSLVGVYLPAARTGEVSNSPVEVTVGGVPGTLHAVELGPTEPGPLGPDVVPVPETLLPLERIPTGPGSVVPTRLLTLQWQPGRDGLTLSFSSPPGVAEVMTEQAFLDLAAAISTLEPRP